MRISRRALSTATSVSLALVGLAFANPAEATVINCGDIITTPNTTIVLTADINCVGTLSVFGVAITGDHVTLDLNGHTVRGDGLQPNDQTSTVGIYVSSLNGTPADHATVKNGTVTGFNTGVYLEAASFDTVTGMRLVDNIGPDSTNTFGEGLQSFLSGGHTITGNQVVHNGPFAGIDIYGPSDNNVVSGNAVQDNNIIDTSGHHGSGGPIMQDIGIWLVNLSTNPTRTTTNNTISSNSVTGNGLDGIQIANYTNGNFVQGNAVTNNGFGQPANGFRDGDGIAVFGSNNLVESNAVSNNGGNGIGVENAAAPNGKNNTIRTNRSTGNGSAANIVGYDLFDANPGCDANVWTTNVFFTRNQLCIT